MAENDFIQDAVNKGFELSVKRKFREIQHNRELFNAKNNKIRARRKLERQNRKKGRK